MFLLLVAALLPFAPVTPWWAWFGGGLLAASAQALSSLGLARRKWMKVTVKALLGAGLAAFVHGTLASPWPKLAQTGVLLAALVLAMASAIPRARRMKRARRAAGECRCGAERVKTM